MEDAKYAHLLRYGYDTGKGWYALINDALDRIFEIDPDANVVDVKEKFGGLRLYVHASNDREELRKIYEITDEAEALADRTCPECGAVFESHDDLVRSPKAWIAYMCADCAKERTDETLD